MKRVLLAIIVLVGFQELTAQYTDIINSKRPGFSESPYSVGRGVYQFETGLFYKNTKSELLSAYPNSFGGELFFRISPLLENLEINLNAVYQADEVQNPFGDNYFNSGFSNLRLGAKYLIFQQEFTDKSKEIRSWKKRTSYDLKRLIPSVGVYAGVSTNLLTKDITEDGIRFKGAVLLQNDFTDRLVVLTNLVVSDIASESMQYAYIVTMTYALSYKWSFFVENTGKFETGYSPEYQLGAGFAYLISPDLQIDASYRTNIFDNYSYNYFSAGASFRIDRHQDDLIETHVQTKTKKGFFSKIFGKK
ncbi:transporter [Lutibacter sp. HS1-25]|uniref:transporter n=1 Tax=Lutibacter sp. HS1-25 TaxID=2485000 RepID=UPI001010E344|nr:transporter [Lutibacter sp. HS1-25]RXP63531.1 transporter [Lutibacter sp. HS1-25]